MSKKMSKTITLREGFWFSSKEKHFPMPVPREKTWLGQRVFLANLAIVESQEMLLVSHSKGWSTCRICDCRNGSSSLELTAFGVTYLWPSGFTHYISKHNVRPSLSFQEWCAAVAAEST